MKVLLQIALLISIAVAVSFPSPVYGQRTEPVAAGEVAPDFTLQDHNGQKVALSEARGKTSVVLVFYRGYW